VVGGASDVKEKPAALPRQRRASFLDMDAPQTYPSTRVFGNILLSRAEIRHYYGVRVPSLKLTETKEWRGPCPIHNGQRDSFAVNNETGAWFCHSACKRGGGIVELETELTGINGTAAFAEVMRIIGREPQAKRRIVATYDYTDEQGQRLYQCVRYEPKDFKQRRPAGKGNWLWNLHGVRLVLYRLPAVIAASTVYVVEGEKDADALIKLGVVATTSPMGARAKWCSDYSESLRGKQVFVIPDDDQDGREHAADVMRSLRGVAASVALVELPGAKDPSEWIARGGTLEDLRVMAMCAYPDAMPDTEETEHYGTTEKGETHAAGDMPAAGTLVTRRVSDVDARPIRWLWPYRIPRGKLTIIAGHPGLGKSQLTADVAARVTAGGKWPDGVGHATGGGHVIVLTAEDDTADTLRPRLEAAGADLERVHVVDGVIRGYSGDGTRYQRQFSLESDLAALDAKLSELERVELVVLDPISVYLGNIDSHVNAEVRGALGPVKDLAERHRAAFVAISHMSKAGGTQALLRVTGSLAFIAAARAGYLVAADPETAERMLFLPLKNNLARPQPGMAFRIETAKVSSAAGAIETSRVVWDDAKSCRRATRTTPQPCGKPEIGSRKFWLMARCHPPRFSGRQKPRRYQRLPYGEPKNR
jgi:putative DNA primase/helicase